MAEKLETLMEYTSEDGTDFTLAFGLATKRLFLNGEPLATEKRFSTQERVIAWSGLLLALVGVAATVVQAWVAAFPSVPPTP